MTPQEISEPYRLVTPHAQPLNFNYQYILSTNLITHMKGKKQQQLWTIMLKGQQVSTKSGLGAQKPSFIRRGMSTIQGLLKWMEG